MKKSHVLIILYIIFIHTPIYSQIVLDSAYSQRIANYKISVNLDPATKLLNGQMLLSWQNTSDDTLKELRFHLYLNAFKNTESTFMRESKAFLNDYSDKDKNYWGWIDVLYMRRKNGSDLTPKIKFIQPDDFNPNDQTVISVSLNKPLFPDSIIELDISFLAKLPKIIARTGFAGDDFFMVAQWFPKIGVYEKAGQRYAEKGSWNCHQYHRHSEFYADFAVYDVDITLPAQYTVAAVGELIDKKTNNDGTVTYSFRAEDVVDFSWAASTKFVVMQQQYKDVSINLFIQPEHKKLAIRHINAVKKALDYFRKHVGEYPYKSVTIIDPPIDGMAAGGMEYPGFFTTFSASHLPDYVKIPELISVHEFGHTYFMDILATNEFEEAWLDEGINSYFETRIMDEIYDGVYNILGVKIFDREIQRLGYTLSRNPQIAPSFEYAWNFPQGSYSMLSYNKPATMLLTLDRLVGRDVMDQIFKTYYNEWKFKHPCSKDFINVVNKVVTEKLGKTYGVNLNWFFEQFLYDTKICDYELANITNHKILSSEVGVFDKGGAKTIVEKTQNKHIWLSEITVYRKGQATMPVEVAIFFDDGSEKILKWDGLDNSHNFVIKDTKKVVKAIIDPQNKNLMDINLINNSYTLKPNNKTLWSYVIDFLFVVQNILQSVMFFA